VVEHLPTKYKAFGIAKKKKRHYFIAIIESQLICLPLVETSQKPTGLGTQIVLSIEVSLQGLSGLAAEG
jgi:hypothetical protein